MRSSALYAPYGGYSLATYRGRLWVRFPKVKNPIRNHANCTMCRYHCTMVLRNANSRPPDYTVSQNSLNTHLHAVINIGLSSRVCRCPVQNCPYQTFPTTGECCSLRGPTVHGCFIYTCVSRVGG